MESNPYTIYMKPNLSAANLKKLRQMVLQRQKSPTAKINSVLRRKARFAKKNPFEMEKHSHELIFAQSGERVRTKTGETKKRNIQFKYGGMNATRTSVGLAVKFSNTRRTIHTHPLVFTGGRLKQVPSPSLADLVILLSMNERSSMIAVPAKKRATQVAGYLVVKKTNKSSPLTSIIKERQNKFMVQNMRNIANPNYWGSLLNLIKEEKYSLIKEDTHLISLFNSLGSNSIKLAELNQKADLRQQGFVEKSHTLRAMYEHGNLGEVEFARKLAELKKEKEETLQDMLRKRIHLETEMTQTLENEKNELTMLQTYQLLLERGFIEEFRKTVKKPATENIGFQRIRPTEPIKGKLFTSTDEKKKLIESELGLHLRLVPAKGFKLVNGQFVKA